MPHRGTGAARAIFLAWGLSAGCRPPPAAPSTPPPPAGSALAQARGWWLHARAAEAAGNWEEAERAWQWVTRLDAASPGPWAAYGRFLADRGRFEASLAAWETAATRPGAGPDVAEGRGRALAALGRIEDAIPFLEAATSGGALTAWPALARAVPDDRVDATLSAWATADPAAGLARGDAARDRGRLPVAIDAWLTSVQDPDADAYAIGRIVPAMYQTCRFGTITRWFDEHDAWADDEPLATLALAVAQATGSPEAGTVLEETARRSGPAEGDPTGAWSEYVEWLLQNGQGDRALSVIDQVGRDVAPDPTWTVFRGWAQAAKGDLRGAVRTWSRLPLSASARGADLRINALVRLGRPKEALPLAVAAVRAFPGEAGLAQTFATVELALGDLPAAQRAIDAFTAWDAAERHRRLAAAALALDDIGLAVPELRAAGQAGSALGLRQLAALLEAGGDTAGALSAWDALLSLDPADATAWVGVARDAPQRRAEALEKALAADPCDADALAIRARSGDCADWQRLWEAAPRSPDLPEGRARCSAIGSASEVR